MAIDPEGLSPINPLVDKYRLVYVKLMNNPGLPARILTIALVALLCPACKEKPGPKDPPQATGETGKGVAAAKDGQKDPDVAEDVSKGGSGSSETYVVRSLLKEASRAELYARGPFINFGTPDQAKYLDKEFNRGWGKSKTGDKMAWIVVGAKARLHLHDWAGGIQALMLRMRAKRPGTLAKIELNGHELEQVELTDEWKLHEVNLEEPTKPGRLVLRFWIGGKDRKQRHADIDWLWMRVKGEFPPLPLKVAARSFEEPRRALVADPPRTYSYYLQVPKESALTFGYGATVETTFKINLHEDGEEPVTLFNMMHTGKRWADGEVDLNKYAGKLVRLEFNTASEGKEREVEASWAEPDIVQSGKRPELAPFPKDKLAKNLIYILLDAGRQDVFNAFNSQSRYATSAVTSLADGGTTFSRAYTPANWTLPSIVGLLTGRYPHSLSPDFNMSEMFKLPKAVPILPEHLHKQGFETAALVTNPFISAPFGLERGWDTFKNFSRIKGAHTNAEALYNQALKWFEERKDKNKRFFLYVHAMDTHDPYNLQDSTPKHFKGTYKGQLKGMSMVNSDVNNPKSDKYLKLTDADKRWVRALYDGEVEYHDDQLGNFISEITSKGGMKDTLVVFSNDHGEEMWDHGALDHGHAMYEEQVKSPLILHYKPLFKPGTTVDHLVEFIDLTPTLLEVLGVQAMPGTHGVSLRGALSKHQDESVPHVIMSGNELTVIVGQFKLFGSKGGGVLFNLEKDPKEKNNLIKSHPIARRACEVYLGEGVSVPNKRLRLTSAGTDSTHKAEKVVLDEKTRRQLEALGYME